MHFTLRNVYVYLTFSSSVTKGTKIKNYKYAREVCDKQCKGLPQKHYMTPPIFFIVL